MLDEALAEPQPEPAPVEEPWDQFMERIRRQELERDRAREAIQAARAAGERDRAMLDAQRPRPEPVPRIRLGEGVNGRQQVGIWDPVMQRYNIRDEQVDNFFDNF